MSGYVRETFIWIAFAVAVALSLLAAIVTTVTWQTPRDRSPVVTSIAIVSLTALLATVLLLPVDIALVSSTTNSLGVKKNWATAERLDGILRTLKIVYYTLYSFDALLCLIVVPFGYFWYEEYDEVEVEEGRTLGSRLFSTLKYTIGFVIFAVIVFLLGFFIPSANRDIGHIDLDYFKQLLAENNGEKALAFGVGLLITLGTLLYLLYTGAGLALLPISIIKTAPAISAPELSQNTATALEQNRERQRQLEMRNTGREEGMSEQDRRELEQLVREERTLVRRERLAAEAQGEGESKIYRAWLKLCAVLRPIKLLCGILALAVVLLVWVSILITGIDKAMHSVCRHHCGYIIGHINIFQPMNWIFLQTAKVFPIDYILMALLVLLLFSASVTGLAAVGIRFLWVRIFQIRKGRTAPQALLVATVMLALMVLAINFSIVMMVAPQYSLYGTQTFCTSEPSGRHGTRDCSNHRDLIVPCSEALKYADAKDVCTPTVMSTFLNRITLTWPVFGAIDFWAQFVFLGVFLLVFVTSLFRAPRLDLAQIDEDAEADEEEGLLASTGRRFGATWQDITGRGSRARAGGEQQTDRGQADGTPAGE